jgi:hypothetical protein
MSSLRRYSTYGLAYVLWFASLILGGLVLFQSRDAYLSVVVMSTYDRTKNNATDLFYSSLQTRSLDQWSYLFLGVLLVVLIVLFEFYYRTGVSSGRLRIRFFQVTALEFAVLFIANLTNEVVIWQVSSFTWRSLFYPVLELLTTAIFLWLWLDGRRRKVVALGENQPA